MFVDRFAWHVKVQRHQIFRDVKVQRYIHRLTAATPNVQFGTNYTVVANNKPAVRLLIAERQESNLPTEQNIRKVSDGRFLAVCRVLS
jgi:hypothetical protein